MQQGCLGAGVSRMDLEALRRTEAHYDRHAGKHSTTEEVCLLTALHWMRCKPLSVKV